jgi:hypothetical protein
MTKDETKIFCFNPACPAHKKVPIGMDIFSIAENGKIIDLKRHCWKDHIKFRFLDIHLCTRCAGVIKLFQDEGYQIR